MSDITETPSEIRGKTLIINECGPYTIEKATYAPTLLINHNYYSHVIKDGRGRLQWASTEQECEQVAEGWNLRYAKWLMTRGTAAAGANHGDTG